MANPYIGSAITDCNSPAVSADKDTYTTKFDRTLEVLDQHDHTNGKGNQIPTAGLATGAVTNVKRGAINVAFGLEVGFECSDVGGTDTEGTAQAVPNGTVTIVSTGKPVLVGLMGYAASLAEHGLYPFSNGADGSYTFLTYVFLFRDGTLIERWLISAPNNIALPVNLITYEDYTPSAGSHTYTLKIGTANAGDTLGLFGCRLRAREL